MKVFFDTIIFVSAWTLPGGRGDQALARVVEGEDTLAFCKPILDELLSVLARKFAHEREALARVAVFLSSVGELVDPHESVAVLSDQTDSCILECALAARANCIVTGDRAMSAVTEFRGGESVRVEPVEAATGETSEGALLTRAGGGGNHIYF